jgi:PAS domain S-box-containing protein
VPPDTHSAEYVQLSRLVEAAPDAIFEIDSEGRIVFANLAAERMFGYTRSELAGLPVEALVPESLRTGHAHLREDYAHQPRTRPMGVGLDLKAQRKDGTQFPVTISLSPNRTESGLSVIAVVRDTTERVQAEEKLRQSDDRLRQAEKLEALARLAGGTAHEFNNLLTMILGYADLLQPALAGAGAEEAQAHVEKIRIAARRAADLTRQLLAFGRRQMLMPQVLDLNLLVADAARVLTRVVAQGIEISVVPAREPAWIRADAAQIEQMIANLVVNARDAMPRGGTLTLTLSRVDLNDEEAHRQPNLAPGPYVLLSVTDTGVGMAPDVQARIFEPFFSTRQLGKAGGLGLATVYGIVSQSGGSISVQSRLGVGTTFNVYLPCLTESHSPKQATMLPQTEKLTGTESILLVEDQPHILALSREFLERLGYKVWSAPGAEEALRLSRECSSEIQLLVTDIVMPGINGRMLAQQLRAERPGLKILYVSGYTDEVFGPGAALSPEEAFLEKPFELEVLGQKIRELLATPAHSIAADD